MVVEPLKLLLISFYYDPDLSAGSFRMKALTDALLQQPDRPVDITIITTMPNRYHDMISSCPTYEEWGNLRIHRIILPRHKSGMRDQARAFLTFARSAAKLVQAGDYDRIFATSSRLMTAALGAYVSKRRKIPLILDIRDLFTDTMTDIFGTSVLRHGISVFRWVERFTFRAADLIIINSPGFETHVRRVAPAVPLKVLTNGIDPEFADYDFTSAAKDPSLGQVKPVVFYAGNVGEGQGLEKILPQLAKQLEDRAEFVVVGNGGRMEVLTRELLEQETSTVRLMAPVARQDLVSLYHQADVLFVHLNNHPAFKKVIPSKLFEYAATGKPVLAGLAGTSAQMVNDSINGSVVFAPCDVQAAVRGLEILLDGPRMFDRQVFIEKFDRREISRNMAEIILNRS